MYFGITSTIVSSANSVSVQITSNAYYIWIENGAQTSTAIIVPFESKHPQLYKCLSQDAKSTLMCLNNSYPVDLNQIRTYIAYKLQNLKSTQDPTTLKKELTTELYYAFPEFTSPEMTERFVQENWHWLEPFIKSEH
jgi:uncharacterized membrane protein